ncbi:MAG: chromosome segregation protein SMC [Chitinophagales bacterium]|nr:chromosome segregation protein SMC [Chitinophagales bacterium]
MKLTSLDIKGFKSFADKTTIHFNNSITGIVGPNGCGKSNIVDSIRWALGEQKTSHLRLDKMEHLIFNGSKKRKASGLAEVTVTFENTSNVLATDYKTVSVTRRLFRNGESEYLLNDVPCRLKDITNLFLDTGVGKDSYAIIELAMVDEILNDKDNSRRRLFEQAAGVSKYKIRKKETLSKLKGTTTDLERVQDLLFEIESNLKSLDSQAKRARRYYKIKDDYKEKSIELAKIQLKDYKEKYKNLVSIQEGEEDKKNAIDSQIKKMEAELEKSKLLSLEKEKELSNLQKEFNEHFNIINEKENRRNLLNEQIKFQKENKEKAETQIEEAKRQLNEIEIKLKEYSEDLKDEEDNFSKAKSEFDSKQSTYNKLQEDHTAIKDSLNVKQNSYKLLHDSILSLEKKEIMFQMARENMMEEIRLAEDALHSKKSEVLELEKEMEQKKMESIEASELLKAKSKLFTNLQGKAEKLSETYDLLKEELVQVNRRSDSKKNEHNLLKNLVDTLEGFPESIKFLSKQKKWADKPPLLSDIFYCGEDYRIAIEKYLEPYMNHYVVNTFEEAVAGTKLLSEASKGRANFFILESFRDHKDQKLKMGVGLLPALDVVEMDKNFEHLARYLLSNVYLVEDQMWNSKEIKDMKGVVLLSKSGSLIKNDHSVSGGAIGLFEGNRLGRAKNLEKLNKQILQLEKKEEELKKKIEKQKTQISSVSEELSVVNMDEVRQQNQRFENEIEKSMIRYRHLTDSSKELQDKIKALRSKIEGEKKEESEIKTQLYTLRNQLASKKSDLSSEDDVFIKLSDRLAEANRELNDGRIYLHKLESGLNQTKQEISFFGRQQNQIIDQQQSNQKLMMDADQIIGFNMEKIERIESELSKEYTAKENYGEKIQKFEEVYFESRGALDELDNNIKEEYRKKQYAETLLQSAKDELNNLKLQLASIKERLSISFKVDLNDLLNEEIETGNVDIDQLEENLEKLKSRLENFGEINPMAIEAYDEMKKRYDFIIEQKLDLEAARKSLEATISEIENTAETQFMNAFNKVRDNFQHVFRTLFTEDDQCDLVLMDAENPLESKIEIIAKPKGKKPTIIDQLSGGEKTLTATALLFSLYLLKPAPFCVFDEVDAPLDDMNIDKFNNIIRQFSKDSQFIIVTHNKKTMTSVDVMYGVTMAEQGISRVVPVDFRSLN